MDVILIHKIQISFQTVHKVRQFLIVWEEAAGKGGGGVSGRNVKREGIARSNQTIICAPKSCKENVWINGQSAED